MVSKIEESGCMRKLSYIALPKKSNDIININLSFEIIDIDLDQNYQALQRIYLSIFLVVLVT